MIKFESDNIVVGFIKNLLTEYNLPIPKVYTWANNSYAVDGGLYIKDDFICRYDAGNNKFERIIRYEEGLYYSNYTSNLKFTGTTYDWNTHEYLGKYLRFLRDYKKLNLMSMYNCYSGRFAKNLSYEFTYNEKKVTIDSNNTDCKILMLPVKLGQEYTIAIDCALPYEIFCASYGTNNYNLGFIDKTYEKVKGSNFANLCYYDKLTSTDNIDSDIFKSVAKTEDDLKMFIKLPSGIKSSIIILEGKYDSNVFTFNGKYIWKNVESGESGDGENVFVADIHRKSYNKSVINFYPDLEVGEKFNYTELADKLKTRHQLLEINSGVSYPFSNKLISYLLDNVINKTETISDNIKRVQWDLYTKYLNSLVNGKPTINYGISSIGSAYGIWNEKYRLVLYNLAKAKNLTNISFDLLGNVDKDIEKYLDKDFDIYSKE